MNQYYDAHSRALVLAFREAINPTLEKVAPDWLLHHIELSRRMDEKDFTYRVEIRLVIKPIGSAKLSNEDADLANGPRRLTSP